ncbi:DUF3311 domain-containing protein [Halovenus halobia]|uniref:DUF3311 domain-containing protein n=1 Tax=Halovenus halobia TaxID=3396622 RepID=UPI003F5534D3
MDSTVSQFERYAWFGVFGVLVTFAIPWFWWGVERVLLGLPIWLWWHIGWMLLAAVSFWTFTQRAWGLGVTGESGAESHVETSESPAETTEGTS